MPTVIDETVASSAYDTSGNGGRKIALASTGDLVFAVKNGTTEVRLYKKVGTNAPVLLANFSVTSLTDVCIENVGNSYIGILYSHSGSTVSYRSVSVTLGTLSNPVNVDSGQTAVGNVTMIANDTKTELHMAVNTKNSTYSNSMNIRYNKGTINADGSVTWGAVEQVTTMNNSSYSNFAINPSIIVVNNAPLIIFEQKSASLSANTINNQESITVVKKDSSLTTGNQYVHSNWSYKNIYQVNTYSQSSPSAIFVPSEINGLPNGRIWVVWQGRDATDSSVDNIRISYSDDGGVTWSAMQKLTSGSYWNSYPTITTNKSGEVFVVWSGRDASQPTYYNIYYIKYSGSTWGASTKLTSNTTNHALYPSSLYDSTFALDFSLPLFIYQNNQTSKIGFYGTWVVTTISITPGYIGQKTSSDKSNILSYSITTDGTMSTITEKINGTTIATRTNPTSGQQFTVSLSQEQWDAIKYTTGHTLTISMGSDTWTYTFDKLLNANDDVLSAVKGVVDLPDHLNKIKAQLGAAIRAKGGTVNDTDAWSAFVSAVGGLGYAGGKRWASGTVNCSSSQLGFIMYDGSVSNFLYITVTGLTFIPSFIIIRRVADDRFCVTYDSRAVWTDCIKMLYTTNQGYTLRKTGNAYVDNTGFRLPVSNVAYNDAYQWIAFEEGGIKCI
jgi:hypothetical protein